MKVKFKNYESAKEKAYAFLEEAVQQYPDGWVWGYSLEDWNDEFCLAEPRDRLSGFDEAIASAERVLSPEDKMMYIGVGRRVNSKELFPIDALFNSAGLYMLNNGLEHYNTNFGEAAERKLEEAIEQWASHYAKHIVKAARWYALEIDHD